MFKRGQWEPRFCYTATMPLSQEKKIRIHSFDAIMRRLIKLGAVRDLKSESTHYYAPRSDNNVTKLVAKASGFEIHELNETDGKFELTNLVRMETLDKGLSWLKAQGYDTVFVVHMQHIDYRYKDGLIGLYTINNDLLSVILDFPEGQHDEVSQELGLDKAERIELPYNKYLERQGLLKRTNIGEAGA
jgi:hypothetical protein